MLYYFKFQLRCLRDPLNKNTSIVAHVPERLEAAVGGRQQAMCSAPLNNFDTPHWMCSFTGSGDLYRQEINQDICLPLIGPDGKYGVLWGLSF